MVIIARKIRLSINRTDKVFIFIKKNTILLSETAESGYKIENPEISRYVSMFVDHIKSVLLNFFWSFIIFETITDIFMN